jgi:hypothetical protein
MHNLAEISLDLLRSTQHLWVHQISKFKRCGLVRKAEIALCHLASGSVLVTPASVSPFTFPCSFSRLTFFLSLFYLYSLLRIL